MKKWVGVAPSAWTFKKEMPKHLQVFARRFDFGLYGLGWLSVDPSGMCEGRSGERFRLFTAYLKTPGAVCGFRDIEAAGDLPWANEWRDSVRRTIELELSIEHKRKEEP